MASARYTLNITPDPPEEPPHEMTAKEKRENFWFYYKWHVIVGIFVAVLLVMLVRDVMTNDPADYTIGVITDSGLPTGAADVLSEKLAPFFDDRDGDGVVTRRHPGLRPPARRGAGFVRLRRCVRVRHDRRHHRSLHPDGGRHTPDGRSAERYVRALPHGQRRRVLGEVRLLRAE